MTGSDPATTVGDRKKTEVGSVFVSNYPPYSFWEMGQVPRVREALAGRPEEGAPLGLYLHIPFCRRRCNFCYFKVYTEKNAKEVERYVDALAREVEILSERAAVAGRPLRFVYFGGGTPSFISAKHLRGLVARVKSVLDWRGVQEVTFECEPGTLTRPKLEAIREIGVTRLSLGVENFDDEILRENGRAHVSKEIHRVVPWIRSLEFDQVNVDLIAGMVGETWERWKETVRKTVEMDADSVTIYQMELPYNTLYSRQVLDGTRPIPVADWETKRAWQAYAFEQLERVGYGVSSAYTMGKNGARFIYRDSVWRGCDLLGAGVASFSHVGGVHYQNDAGWEPYLNRVEAGELPVARAFATSKRERLTRETILQLKLGRLDPEYFRKKFDADILDEFAPAFERLRQMKVLEPGTDEVRLTREGLLRVDTLLPEFYDERYQGARYT